MGIVHIYEQRPKHLRLVVVAYDLSASFEIYVLLNYQYLFSTSNEPLDISLITRKCSLSYL